MQQKLLLTGYSELTGWNMQLGINENQGDWNAILDEHSLYVDKMQYVCANFANTVAI